MNTSYIFSGIGYSLGEYKITNADILQYIKNSGLSGFDEKRIENSEDYRRAKEENPDLEPFHWLVENLMGFKTRYHVVPFPPAEQQYKHAENSIHLCVRAVDNALQKSGVSPHDIDAWFIGTATSPHPTPGIAEEVKAFFTEFDNQTPTYSLTSACVGFNLNLQAAISYFKANPKAIHIVVAHAEVMSRLLLNEKDFVPFVTFGDSSSAVVLSKVETDQIVGITEIENFEDMQMLDFLGANKKGNLYMDARMVKSRAVPNIANVFKSLMAKNNWSLDDVKIFVPHQTGNAIVHSVADKAEIPLSKVYQDVQKNLGNLSGSSVPVSLAVMDENNKLKPGDKILTAVAGLGGEYGGFSYIMPQNQVFESKTSDLKGKTVLITGASGALGTAVAKSAAQKGANLILHYNSNSTKLEALKTDLCEKYSVEISLIKANFLNNEELSAMCDLIRKDYGTINYLINTQAITGSLSRASKLSNEEIEQVTQVNYKATKYICERLSDLIKDCVLFTGSVGEDAQFPGSASYVASKRALRAYARSFATKVYSKNTRCIYYIPGIIDAGMADKLDEAQTNASMMMAGQKQLIPLNEIAERIVKSVYIPKVLKVRNSYEGVLLVRKDGYVRY